MNWALQLSKQHQPKNGQADIYGVIVYTDAHAHVKKVLEDEDYWRSFNELSGPQWGIFAIRAACGAYKYPESRAGFLAYMVPVWKEPAVNKELVSAFELGSTEKLPLFLIFNMTKDGETNKLTIPITNESVEKTLHSITEIIKKVTSAIKNIDLDNLHSPDGVYSAVSFSVSDYKDKKLLKDGITLWRLFRSL